ncbi:MAG: FtsW/RodA/SpoVE family cell cycle protein, partial [Xanthomonadales bacterium]|nr:FtsW/RodA/SpoVE family cell cycle protein [Xanthomonadales bacterium]
MRRLVPGWVRAPRMDYPLLGALLLVIAAGLLVLYSASGQDMGLVIRQAVRLGVGLLALLVLSQVPPHILRLWTPWLYLAGMLLVALTLVIGTGRGTQRWLDLGLFRVQPSEVMKLAVPMMVAWYLHPRVLPPNWKESAVALVILAAPAVVIVQQPDLG